MKKKTLTLVLLLAVFSAQAQTLEECQQAAEKNYPRKRFQNFISFR